VATYVHSGILVTGEEGPVAAARARAEELGLGPSAVQVGRNGFDSFAVLPNGAGAEHPAGKAHADAIAELTAWLDGLRGVEWVAVSFGRERGEAEVIGDCARPRAKRPWN